MNLATTVLHDAQLIVAESIGSVIEFWGFRKSLGRIWAVLFLAAEPLDAATLAERLSMSTGAVSMALSELQDWMVIRRVWRPGERREYFTAETDLWRMISKVISERERFMVRAVCEQLEQSIHLLRTQDSPEAQHAVRRAEQLRTLARLAERVIDTFIASQQADFSAFGQLLSLSRRPKRVRK